jgi:hypothetical protein
MGKTSYDKICCDKKYHGNYRIEDPMLGKYNLFRGGLWSTVVGPSFNIM